MSLRVLYLSRAERFPEALEGFLDVVPGNHLQRCESPEEVEHALQRGIVELLLIDADRGFDAAAELCTRLKADPFNSVVPIVFFSREHRMEQIATAFERGADEFLSGTQTGREQQLRLRMVLERAARDVAVNPTTMLPGTKIIQLDIQRRIASGETFAVCYADIDSFKEFNDKHSYHRGDRVIWIVSTILRDIVRRLSRRGFVGHVGGDDFIFTLPVEDLEAVSKAIIETFDTLMPLQYTREDRERGHYLAEDRQGNIRETPLMTISIGCVTNVHRRFTHPARVSELANEMKSYAKTFPGSLYIVDRRRDVRSESAVAGDRGIRERGSK
ncbi:MAG TPA: diguanylate cyclase [Gemmatimonadota bacterium]|nr:diguanylate cyclase [Gemmatimonadota bacterium]